MPQSISIGINGLISPSECQTGLQPTSSKGFNPLFKCGANLFFNNSGETIGPR